MEESARDHVSAGIETASCSRLVSKSQNVVVRGAQMDGEVERKSMDVSCEIDSAPNEIRRRWVGSNDSSLFSSHRNLARYWRELKCMISTLRDYAYSDEHNQPCVMKAVLDYIMCVHKTYLDAMYAWIEEADEKQRQKLSVPAYPRVRDLMKKYDPSVKNKIERYFKNSLLDPNERCLSS